MMYALQSHKWPMGNSLRVPLEHLASLGSNRAVVLLKNLIAAMCRFGVDVVIPDRSPVRADVCGAKILENSENIEQWWHGGILGHL